MSCGVNCQYCDTITILTEDNQRETILEKEACSSCFESIKNDSTGWEECENCGTWIDENNKYWSDIRDELRCQSCYDQEIQCFDCDARYHESNGHECSDDDDESSFVMNYSYKPRANFHGDSKYYFGVELEVETSRHGNYSWGAEHCHNKMDGRGYLKSDGSLSNGFEIVTHPHSLDEIQNKFPWEMLEDLREDGFRSWNTTTCGLHVHVSRTAFNASSYSQRETHQIKFLKLIYDNERQVKRLAGRSSNYATFGDKGKVVPKVKMGNQTDGRYSAVNVENDQTLEVRVFRGSLRKERVLSSVEFVHAAVEYTRNLKVAGNGKPLSWVKFVSYIAQQSDMYPNLFLIMNELFDKDTDIPNEEE